MYIWPCLLIRFCDFFKKNGFLQNRSNMQYLGIFVLPDRSKIKFHGDRPSQKSIWTNLDPKSS